MYERREVCTSFYQNRQTLCGQGHKKEGVSRGEVSDPAGSAPPHNVPASLKRVDGGDAAQLRGGFTGLRGENAHKSVSQSVREHSTAGCVAAERLVEGRRRVFKLLDICFYKKKELFPKRMEISRERSFPPSSSAVVP